MSATPDVRGIMSSIPHRYPFLLVDRVLEMVPGRRIVAMAREGLRPSAILTRPAFENAVRLLMALGGSTNAVVHLPAIAGRAGVRLDLDDFDRLARTTPTIANVRPSGQHHMEDLAEAGGIPAVLKVLEPLLHGVASRADERLHHRQHGVRFLNAPLPVREHHEQVARRLRHHVLVADLGGQAHALAQRLLSELVLFRRA